MAIAPGSIVTAAGYGTSVGILLGSDVTNPANSLIAMDFFVISSDRIGFADVASVPNANITLVTAPAPDPGGGPILQ